MDNTIHNDVKDFHRKFDHPAPGGFAPLDEETLKFRKKLIREEAEELCEAVDHGDPVKICREAVDLVYVAVGALINAGLPFQDAWDAVQAANMEKTPKPPGAPRGTKPGKPEGWIPPDARIRAALERWGFLPTAQEMAAVHQEVGQIQDEERRRLDVSYHGETLNNP